MDFIVSWFEKIRSHPELVYLFLFTDSFLTTFPIAGVIVLETPVLLLAGWFSAQGAINFWYASLIATLGGILGDAFGYVFGQRLVNRLMHRPEIINHRSWERAQTFILNHGGKSIVFARFIGPLRTVLPLVAGMMRMKNSTFWFYNIVGAILQTFTFTGIGYFFGAHWREILAWTERGGWISLFVLAVVGIWYWRRPTVSPSTPSTEHKSDL